MGYFGGAFRERRPEEAQRRGGQKKRRSPGKKTKGEGKGDEIV